MMRASAFMARSATVHRPCRYLPFLCPLGAPGDVPSCILHRPFFIAGPQQGNDIALHIGEHVEQAPSHARKRAQGLTAISYYGFPLALQNLRTED